MVRNLAVSLGNTRDLTSVVGLIKPVPGTDLNRLVNTRGDGPSVLILLGTRQYFITSQQSSNFPVGTEGGGGGVDLKRIRNKGVKKAESKGGLTTQ